jgi:hypothetical protein
VHVLSCSTAALSGYEFAWFVYTGPLLSRVDMGRRVHNICGFCEIGLCNALLMSLDRCMSATNWVNRDFQISGYP